MPDLRGESPQMPVGQTSASVLRNGIPGAGFPLRAFRAFRALRGEPNDLSGQFG